MQAALIFAQNSLSVISIKSALEWIFNLQGMEILYSTSISYHIINCPSKFISTSVFCLHNHTKFSHSGARWKI